MRRPRRLILSAAAMPHSDVKSRILILDEEPEFREALAAFLAREGHDVRTPESAREAFEMLALKPAELILADINAEGAEPDEFLRKLRRRYPETVPIVVTGYGSIEQAVVATKDGAFDYITKPVVDEEIRLVVEKALRHQALLFENRSLHQQLEGICGVENVVGSDQRLQRIFEIVDAVAAGTGGMWGVSHQEIEHATVLCRELLIGLEEVPEPCQRNGGRRLPPPDSLTALFARHAMPLKDALEIPEQMIIQAALQRNNWNRQATAHELQIDRTTLYKKMRRYKLGAALAV